MKDSHTHPISSWRSHLLIFFFLFLVAPIHMLPLFPHFSTHLLGDVMDTAEYPLDEWWTAHALVDLKTNPFITDYMFYPLGQNLVQHTYTFLDGLIYTLMRSFVPLIPFHNLLIWMNFFINASAAYLLIFYLIRIPWLSFIGALAFGHSPTLISYYKTASLLEGYNLVFFILFSYLCIREQRLKWAVWAGLVWGLTLYNYPYYFVFGGLWLLILLAYHWWPWEIQLQTSSPSKVSLRTDRIIWLIFLGAIVALIFAPRGIWERLIRWNLINWWTMAGFIGTASVAGHLLRTWFGKRNASPESSLLEKSLPIKWRPLPGKEVLVSIAFSGVILGIAALVGFPYFWSFLHDEATRVAVRSLPSDFARYSVDLVSFVAPFNTWLDHLYARIASDWVSGRPLVSTPAFLGFGFIGILCLGIKQFFKRPELRLWFIGWMIFLILSLGPFLKIHGLIIETFPLPAYLLRFIPVVESARTLSRFLLPTMLLTCLLVCLILKPFLLHLRPPGRKVLLWALGLMVGFEYGLLPYPLSMKFSDYRIPEVYSQVAKRAAGRSGVLLDLPLFFHSGGRSAGKGETRRFFYQTVHQQKMIGGVSSKLDDSVFAYFQNQPALFKFWRFEPVDHHELAALIYAYKVNWIVLDKKVYPPDILKAYRSVFDTAPYIKIFYEDPRYIGLSVELTSPTLEERALHYWGRLDALSGLIYPGFSRPLKSGQPAPLELVIPQKLWKDLEIEFAPETVRTFDRVRLSLEGGEEKVWPFPSIPLPGTNNGANLRLNKLSFPSESLRSIIRLKIIPGKIREPLSPIGSPFPFALLSIGEATGLSLTPDQALIGRYHFFIEEEGITAFRLSEKGRILEKIFFPTQVSIREKRALAYWLRHFPEKEYLALLVYGDGSPYLTPEITDLLKEFGASDPLKQEDRQHSYALFGRKGGRKEEVRESHTITTPAFIHSADQSIRISDLRLHLP